MKNSEDDCKKSREQSEQSWTDHNIDDAERLGRKPPLVGFLYPPKAGPSVCGYHQRSGNYCLYDPATSLGPLLHKEA